MLKPPYDPVAVTDLDVAFPAHALDIMPAWEDIPDDFKGNSRNEWVDFQSRWFSNGLPASTKLHIREGFDGEAIFRHLRVIQGSYAPKHEHKMAAVAYLSSLWIEKIEYE